MWSTGDSYNNALAETINEPCKAEVIHRRAAWRTKEGVELATLDRISWFNNHRLLGFIGYVPPAEFEANYCQPFKNQAMGVRLEPTGFLETRDGSAERLAQ